MTDIQTCAAKVSIITPDTSISDIADAYLTLEGMAQRIKELRDELDQRIFEKIKESGDFTIGDFLYTLAKPKKVKVRDVAAAVEKLLEVTGGDMGRFCGCLAANPLKHGTVNRLLDELGAPPETFDVLFETTFDEEVKVSKVNLAFVKK
jgi:hypothetical protein